MLPSERFSAMQTQTQHLLQQNAPVRVRCFRRILERQTGAVFLQVRMINCCEKTVQAVFLRAEGKATDVETAVSISVPVSCWAEPHSIFGEEKILSLNRTMQSFQRVLVDSVVFSDGTSWSRNSDDAIQSPDAPPLKSPAQETLPASKREENEKPKALPPLAHPAMLRPALPSERPRGPSTGARLLSLLFYFLGALALITALAFVIFFLRRYSIHFF